MAGLVTKTSYRQLVGQTAKRFVRAASLTVVANPTAIKTGDSYGGVTLAAGDAFLVLNAASPSANGIYIAGASGSTRRADFATPNDIFYGVTIYVSAGTLAITQWTLTTAANPVVVGTTALGFTEMADPGMDADEEVPAGDIDGENDTFTLANPNPVLGSVKVYLDGIRQYESADGDYQMGTDENKNKIIYNAGCIPQPGEMIIVDYKYL